MDLKWKKIFFRSLLLPQIMQQVSHIWGNCKGQHILSAMDKPCTGKTTSVIMVSPLPAKYFKIFS